MKHEYVRLTYEIRFEDGSRCIHDIMLNKEECFPEFFIARAHGECVIITRLWREFLVAEFPDEIRPIMQELKANKKAELDEQYSALDKEFENLV